MAGKKQHFVLVHGSCHGGWSWFKVASLLAKAGHEVTSMDLLASGVDLTTPDQVASFVDYSKPLLDLLSSIPDGNRVVLVGHSSGGLCIALACEKFPAKVAVAVFVAGFMPDPAMPPSQLLYNYFFVQKDRIENWGDSIFTASEDPLQPLPRKLEFGPKFMREYLYNSCPLEDYMLATMLKREAPFYREDWSAHGFVTASNYLKTRRAYVVCKDDQVITESFQRWMIENSPPVDEVVEIDGADHMPMFSKPIELCHQLIKIADAACCS